VRFSEQPGASTLSQVSLSPDGAFQLDLLVSEWSLTLWTHAPRITDVTSNAVLFDLWGTNWDAQATWTGANGLRLDLRRYDLPGAFALMLDLGGGTYSIPQIDAHHRPLADVRCGIELAFDRAHSLVLASLKAMPTARATSPSTQHRDDPGEGKNTRGSTFFCCLFRDVTRSRRADEI
jgi:hypothetical protein